MTGRALLVILFLGLAACGSESADERTRGTGGELPDLFVDEIQVQQDPLRVSAHFGNVGADATSDAMLRLEIRNEQGEVIRSPTRTVGVLAAGTSKRQGVRLKPLPRGSYEAVMTILSTSQEGEATLDNNREATPIVVDTCDLDLLLVVDRSGKPASQWSAVVAALDAFFQDPGATGSGVSITLFPSPTASDPCDASSYNPPQIPATPSHVASLPTDAQALASALGVSADGSTPTLAALSGTYAFAQARMAARPERRAVVCLVTDGFPSGCGEAADDWTFVRAAITGARASGIDTHVVGLFDAVSKSDLDQLAADGGTASASLFPDPTQLTSYLQGLVAQNCE